MRISDGGSDVCSSDLRGRFANDEGRILPGLYCVGWARRGPTGTIGTNRPDGFMIAEKIGEDIGKGATKAGRPGLDALLAERQVRSAWRRGGDVGLGTCSSRWLPYNTKTTIQYQ